jgi:putative addiction module component (TIGR02574 family)
MPTNVPLPPPGFDNLAVQERLDYLESLWDRIAANAEWIAVRDWHRDVLDDRLNDLQARPDTGDSWDVVQERLRTKFESQR